MSELININIHVLCAYTAFRTFIDNTPPPALDELHPSLWHASWLAKGHTRCVDTGHPAMPNQPLGGGCLAESLIDCRVAAWGRREASTRASIETGCLAKLQRKGDQACLQRVGSLRKTATYPDALR